MLLPQRADMQRPPESPKRRRPAFFFYARATERNADGSWSLSTERKSGSLPSIPALFSVILPPGTRAGTVLRVLLSFDSTGLPLFHIVLPKEAESPDRFRSNARTIDQSSNSLARALAAAGLGDDAASAAVFALARNWGLSLDPRRLDRVRKAVLRSHLDEGSGALVATAADDKGLILSDAAIEDIAGSLDPHPRGDGRKRRGEETLHGDPTAESLKGACERFQEDAGPLALMNGVGGKDAGRWMAFPLRVKRGAVEIGATLRVLLRNAEVLRLALDIFSPSRYWFLELSGPLRPGSVARLSADPPLGNRAESVRIALDAALASCGLTVAVSEGPVTSRFPECGMPASVSVDEEA
jgi:hypothetical protein